MGSPCASSPPHLLSPPQRPSLLSYSPRSSVPSGRIGTERDAVFRNNDEFRGALAERELQDVAEVENKLGRK
jgi:hypothetical protein